MTPRVAAIGAALWLAAVIPASASEEALIPPASQRFANDDVQEVPNFQRHLLPLMGRLGCNTRSCHGSFQGAGGFRLSLFGYDFKVDHDALLKPESHRVDRETPEASKILQKPTLAIPHKGGKRMEEDSWQYRMFVRWIEDGAKGVENPVEFERLEVIPAEIVFEKEGEAVALQVIAHWADGSREDVTCISRYRTNDESIAEISPDGVVTSHGKGDTHVVAFYDNGVAVTQVILPVSDKVGPNYPDVPAPTTIDQHVVAKLRKLGVVPSEVCTDAEFLRRVSLDLTGTLPAPAEIDAFVADASPAKRAAKVEDLLARPSYAAWWTTKLCDLTGASARNVQLQNVQGLNETVARNWYRWIYKRVEENIPYDQIVAGIVLASSRRPGQSYDDYNKEQTAYYRQSDPVDFSKHETLPYYWIKRNSMKPEDKALNFSYTFLGVRLECAQCHKHPFDQWTQNDFNQFAAFFNTIRYGVAPDAQATARKMRDDLGIDPKKGNVQQQLTQLVRRGEVIPWQEVFVVPRGDFARQRPNQAPLNASIRTATPRVLGGDEVTLGEAKDPREPLMEWMRKKDNPYFARAWINRVWANYFGSGIVNPPDDMNLANPPSNEALLQYLAEGFIDHGFDMKWLHREIIASQTYQRSWRPNETNRLDERNFSRAIVRRLPAEILIDAITMATAGTDAAPQLAADLEKRATGLKNVSAPGNRGSIGYASQVFGGSTRESNCDCARSNEPNLLQSIYLQNDNELLTALDRSESWVSERAAIKNRRPADLARSLEALAQRVARQSREEGAPVVDANAAEEIDRRLDEQGRKTAAERERLRPEKDPVRAAEALVREAYLRTVSREPSASESTVARNYLKQAGDEATGLRDLLWALLNTKEFITNH
jgi:hypothetical protein